jgi:hypothetical protein
LPNQTSRKLGRENSPAVLTRLASGLRPSDSSSSARQCAEAGGDEQRIGQRQPEKAAPAAEKFDDAIGKTGRRA